MVLGLASSRWLPINLFGLVLGLDLVQARIPSNPLLNGPLDEPAHLATAALVLLAVVGLPALLSRPTVTGCALLGSVAIDVDHVPLYAGVPHVAAGGRPYSHSLLAIALLLLAAGALPRRRGGARRTRRRGRAALRP